MLQANDHQESTLTNGTNSAVGLGLEFQFIYQRQVLVLTWHPAQPSLWQPEPWSRPPGTSSCSWSAPSLSPATQLEPPSADQYTDDRHKEILMNIRLMRIITPAVDHLHNRLACIKATLKEPESSTDQYTPTDHYGHYGSVPGATQLGCTMAQSRLCLWPIIINKDLIINNRNRLCASPVETVYKPSQQVWDLFRSPEFL